MRGPSRNAGSIARVLVAMAVVIVGTATANSTPGSLLGTWSATCAYGGMTEVPSPFAPGSGGLPAMVRIPKTWLAPSNPQYVDHVWYLLANIHDQVGGSAVLPPGAEARPWFYDPGGFYNDTCYTGSAPVYAVPAVPASYDSEPASAAYQGQLLPVRITATTRLRAVVSGLSGPGVVLSNTRDQTPAQTVVSDGTYDLGEATYNPRVTDPGLIQVYAYALSGGTTTADYLIEPWPAEVMSDSGGGTTKATPGDAMSFGFEVSNPAMLTAVIRRSSDGALIRTLRASAPVERGGYSIAWDGRLADGSVVGDGAYVLHVSTVDPQAHRSSADARIVLTTPAAPDPPPAPAAPTPPTPRAPVTQRQPASTPTASVAPTTRVCVINGGTALAPWRISCATARWIVRSAQRGKRLASWRCTGGPKWVLPCVGRGRQAGGRIYSWTGDG